MNSWDISLSSTYVDGVAPTFLNILCSLVHIFVIVGAVLFFSGSARMQFVS